MNVPFPEIRFQGTLRPSQSQVERLAEAKLSRGKRRLHVVAPPGSGKTIIGLHLWAHLVKRPALVLSPNSAIQAQWAARCDLFHRVDGAPIDDVVSTSPESPELLTSLTYQSITLPASGDEQLDARAIDRWVSTALENDQAESCTAAEIWIEDLRRNNPDFYSRRLSYYRKRLREEDARRGAAMSGLHEGCLQTLERLRGADVGMLILDECHHLMGHWGRVLSEVGQYFGDPIVLGLTATPPDRDGRHAEDLRRYDQFFGDIDFEVPVPAVVKDGYLAPYQDLAYLVRPERAELDFVAETDDRFDRLVVELCQSRGENEGESLVEWLTRVVAEKRLPTGPVSSWAKFCARDRSFAEAAVRFLSTRGVTLPTAVRRFGDELNAGIAPHAAERTSRQEASDPSTEVDGPLHDSQLQDSTTLAGRSPSDESLDTLITVIDRYTRHHLRRSERASDHQLAERIVERLRLLGVQITEQGHRRCATPVSRVIAYSRGKAKAIVPILKNEMLHLGDGVRAVVIADYEKTSATSEAITHLMDEEVGGAVAAFRQVLADPDTNRLDPILLTGSTVLVDADLVVRFTAESQLWLRQKGKRVELSRHSLGDHFQVQGSGSDWSPRVYVEMITDLFQRGICRTLVGTRGLLGEGWDATRINVLIDLSTATTSTTVNQLRGRSIRLDSHSPRKVANNWDVVCIAPEFHRGLEDYHRFRRKHDSIFGLCDDGAIEKGVGHVHAAFTSTRPELGIDRRDLLNDEMLARAGRRGEAYRDWRIGQPYRSEPIHAVEYQGDLDAGYPPFDHAVEPWTSASLADDVAQAVYASLRDFGLLTCDAPLRIATRDGGYVRLFLDGASEEESACLARSIAETLGPVRQPRYVIPRSSDPIVESFGSRWMPRWLRRYLASRRRRLVMWHAVPSELATNRQRVRIFQRHWNALVSPGEAVFVKNEAGQRHLGEAAAAGQLPRSIIHEKEVFY